MVHYVSGYTLFDDLLKTVICQVNVLTQLLLLLLIMHVRATL